MGNTVSDTVKKAIGIEVLSMEQAYEEMALNETTDRYLKDCTASPANAAAISKVHMKPCDPYTKAKAEQLTASALQAVPERLRPSNTIKIGFFEHGLPHTRPPNTIWFPESALNEVTTSEATAKFNNTFLHECIHLHQREHEAEWNKFYEASWGFKPYKVALPPKVEARRRINPDTMRAPLYIWRDEFIPVAVYSKPDDADLRQVGLIFVRKDGSSSSVLPLGWAEFFGSRDPSVCEHPHEMAAYYLADGENPFDCVAAKLLRGKFNLGR